MDVRIGVGGYGGDVYGTVDEQVLGCGYQRGQYGCGEVSGDGDVSCVADYAFAVEFGEAVDVIVCVVFDAVFVVEVDDACVFGYGVPVQQSAVAAEYAVDVCVVNIGGVSEVCLAYEARVNVGECSCGVVLGVYPSEGDVRVVKQQAYECAVGVSVGAYDCGIYHYIIMWNVECGIGARRDLFRVFRDFRDLRDFRGLGVWDAAVGVVQGWNVAMCRAFFSSNISLMAKNMPDSSTSPNSSLTAVPNMRMVGERDM